MAWMLPALPVLMAGTAMAGDVISTVAGESGSEGPGKTEAQEAAYASYQDKLAEPGGPMTSPFDESQMSGVYAATGLEDTQRKIDEMRRKMGQQHIQSPFA